MIRRTKIQILTALAMTLSLGLSARPAQAASLAQMESEGLSIIATLNGPGRNSPSFRCFQMGRLKSFNEIFEKAVLRQQKNVHSAAPRDGAYALQRFQNFAHEYIPGFGCDPSFDPEQKGSGDLFDRVEAIKARMQGISQADLVIFCFHLGRLSKMNGRLDQFVQRSLRAGQAVNPEAKKLSDTTAWKVRKLAPQCKPGNGL